MNIAFRAEGSAIIGMGHLVRCSAIAKEFIRQGHDVCFFCRVESAAWLQKNGLHIQKIYEESVREQTEAFIQSACSWKVDVAVLDTYELTQDCYRYILAHMPTIAIDDDARISYAATYILNPNIYAKELDYSNCRADRFLLGGQYTILRECFQEANPIDIRVEAQRILVTMGGVDINNCTPKILQSLGRMKELEVLVVMGPLSSNIPEVQAAANRCLCKVEIIHDPPDMVAVMAQCDIAIASAGSTVYELCVLGMPTLLIQQADNQRYIADYFRCTQAMHVLGEYDKINKLDIQSAVFALMKDEGRRQRMHEHTLQMVNACGVKHIVSAVIENL